MLDTGEPKRESVWLWVFCLNVDAPLVALAWQELFANIHGVALMGRERAVLFLAVWGIYTVDRLLDVATGTFPRTWRHQAHARFGRALWPLLAVVGLLGVWMALFTLNGRAWSGTFFLALASCAHLLATAGGELFGRSGPWKELRVGLVFALGCQLVPWSRGAFSMLNLASLLFAGLCVANCRLIELWERPVREGSARIWGAVTLVLALLGGIYSVIAWPQAGPERTFALCVALSGTALWGLTRDLGWGAETRRALADLALMSPLVFWIAS